MTKRLARRVLPAKLYRRFTREQRRLTLSLPLTKAALMLGRLRLKAGGGSRGVDRLDAIIVINLARRPERLADFTREMERLRIFKYSRFEAISEKDGILGCNKSHAACLADMIERGDRCVMICEDDARFLVSRDELDVLVEAFLNDERAEVACLAYHHLHPPKPYNRLFLRAADDTRTTACYLVKSSVAQELLHLVEEGIEGLSAGGDRMLYGVDIIWASLQRSRVFLIPIKRAVRQADGYSDIEQRVVSYGGL